MSNQDIVTIRFNADVEVEQEIVITADITREELMEGLKSERFTPALISGSDEVFEANIRDAQSDGGVVGVVAAQRINAATFSDFETVDVVVEDEEDELDED